MSKAFTREDDLPAETVVVRPVAVLPPGTPNLITPAGALRLRRELEDLVNVQRPAAADSASGEERKRALAAIDHRIRQLERTLPTMVVTGPPPDPDRSVHFGATVTVRNRAGEVTTYRIVGVDETDLDRDWVSWLSPIARALLNRRAGERVPLKLPGGEEQLEILAVTYE